MRSAFGILEVDALYVAHYLNNAGVFEFNPYKGKKAYDVIVKSPLAELSRPQFLETFTMQSIFEKATFPADYDDIVTVSKNSETIIEGVKHCHFIVNNTMYLVPQDTVNANKTNLLKEFMEECETVNFGKNAVTTNSVCPTDKLIIDNVEQQNIKAYKKALRTRLQEKAPELVGYVHDEEIHTGYNIYANEENTSFYKLLDGYLKRTVSLHPLEWDFEKIRNDKVCETRGKAPVNEHACCDIFADLRKADEKTFKTNSFYFACAPYFYNKMEALGLLFRNPYEGVPVRLRHPISEAERKKVKDKEYNEIGICLFTEVCKRSFDLGYDGYVEFMAKTKLIEYYKKVFGASLIGSQQMIIETRASKKLVDKYYGGVDL